MNKAEIEKLGDHELQKLYVELDDIVHNVGCFNTMDIIMLDWVEEILDKREIFIG